jgi:hypothetical protein
LKLFTEVIFPPFRQKLDYSASAVFIGSCFSENIGGWLTDLKFDVSSNPLGISYNPISLSRQVSRALASDEVAKSELVGTPGGMAHLDFYSALNRVSPEAYLKNINQQLGLLSNKLARTDFLFLTFGTAIVYEHIEAGRLVNNCHKLPAEQFRKRFLDEAEMYQVVSTSIEELQKQNPGVKVICTVSPIRHLRNGARDNMRSKARLLRLCEMLENNIDFCSYLPVYELVMDQLRDYRFYRQDDLLHLNEMGTAIIKEKFTEALIDSSAYELMKKVEKWQAMKNHKIMHPESEQANAFQAKLRQEENALKSLLPGRF